MATEPEGADVYYKEYSDVGGEWRHLGRGPLKDVRLPRGIIRFRIEKEGFVPVYLARNLAGKLTLEPAVLTPGADDGLVRVPGGSLPVNLSGFNSDDLVSMDPVLDRRIGSHEPGIQDVRRCPRLQRRGALAGAGRAAAPASATPPAGPGPPRGSTATTRKAAPTIRLAV